MSDLESALRRVVTGDVRFDTYSRLLYSTDASMYQVEPIGVVIPRQAEEVQAVIEVANRMQVPILPRGGGTSLTGQTVNHAVVIDFSRYMDRVLEVNVEEQWARVQPGVVQDNLNDHVRPHGLLFGPDTSTSSRATLGGMIGNNSGGSHSIAYGLTVKHVIELTAILADGTWARFGEIAPGAFAAKTRLPGLEGQIYREVARIRDQYAEDIRTRYPKHWRRVCGYNLDELVGAGAGAGEDPAPRPLNMARLVVGSEGTLMTVVEAKVRLVPRPKRTALDVLHFHDIQEALECSQAILETGPYAVELTDKMILDLARGNLEHAKRMAFVQGDPAAILMVEYAGGTDAEVQAKIEALEARRARDGFAYASHIARDVAEQQSIWKLRKAGLGLLFGLKGEAKPIAFIEDTAVDPKHLPEFVPRFRDVMARYGAEGAYYGHCSVGCLHIRPVINLKTQRGIEQVQAMADEICDLVLEYGGAFSSEHGDGRARSPFLERVFGPTVFKAFREFKHAFDPKNLMNPGNLVDSPGVTQHLRYGPQYQTWEPITVLDFSERGGFAGAVEMCNGVGVCRKTLEGTMCPSYMVTRDEEHTTRGRANALRAVLSGKVPPAEFTGRRLYDVMDLCLECKACKSECPANVDMAKMKYEFLYHYHTANGLPLRNRLFGHIGALSAIGSRLAPLSNWIARTPVNRWLMQRVAGIDRRRPLPAFARGTLTDWFDRRRRPDRAPRGEVVLFHDTFVTFNTPRIGQAAVELLEAAGYRVHLVNRKCCGRPLISKGMLDEAREHARWNVAKLAPLVERGMPVIGLEPSCLLTLRDEYVELVPGVEARQVARSSFLIEEVLLNERARGLSLEFEGAAGRKALLHGHCHQKSLVGTAPTVEALRWAGYEVSEVDSGCCGMAGSFGFEQEHYDMSVALGSRRLAPAVRDAGGETEIVAPGISCRQQIEHLTGRRAKHPAEVLREALAPSPDGASHPPAKG
ncbi:MAG TPA: FAD-linked oxidase C-terminal domain-containing protein [Candidatus Binatia bacterium]|nr:FAD-linked oxidase C-terminal domain-containing protein [Candidatus Binatia bacterium]